MPPTHNADGSDIIHKLLKLIDTYCGIGAKIRDLLLELARWMDETEQCQQDEICRKIKHILKEKIDQRKISERWIEDSLPQEYKRQYTKSELSSVSKENKQEQVLSIGGQETESYSEKELDTDDYRAIADADPNTNRLLKWEIDEFERCINGLEISESQVQFPIPREKYGTLEAAMKESKNAIYVVFRKGTFQSAHSDNAQI
jgi:hypothetical protein